MTLRAQVVEAMAQARYERIGGVSWAECPAKQPWLEDAAGDLDAALDVLGTQAENRNWLRVDGHEAIPVVGLLAVLRS